MKNSVLGPGVVVEAGAVVEDSVLMEHVTVRAGACVRYSILDANVTVCEKATVGEAKDKTSEIAVVGADVVIPVGKAIPAGAMIADF